MDDGRMMDGWMVERRDEGREEGRDEGRDEGRRTFNLLGSLQPVRVPPFNLLGSLQPVSHL